MEASERDQSAYDFQWHPLIEPCKRNDHNVIMGQCGQSWWWRWWIGLSATHTQYTYTTHAKSAICVAYRIGTRKPNKI